MIVTIGDLVISFFTWYFRANCLNIDRNNMHRGYCFTDVYLEPSIAINLVLSLKIFYLYEVVGCCWIFYNINSISNYRNYIISASSDGVVVVVIKWNILLNIINCLQTMTIFVMRYRNSVSTSVSSTSQDIYCNAFL